MRWWMLGLLGCCVLPPVALADRTVVAGPAIQIRLEVNQPTAVCFPEEVGSVTAGWDKDTLSADQYGPCVTLQTPYGTLAGRLIVMGKTGQVYSLAFKVGTPVDDIVRIVLAAPVTTKTLPWTPSSLVRGLREATKPLPGARASTMAVPKWTDARLTVVDLRTLHVGGLEGVVFTVQNGQAEPLGLDERIGDDTPPVDHVVHLNSILWPALYEVLRVHVSSRLLPSGAQAQIIVILKKTES